MVNVAVMGYGTVGSGVVKVILDNNDIVSKNAGDKVNLKYVLDIRDFPGDPAEKVIRAGAPGPCTAAGGSAGKAPAGIMNVL